MALGDVTGVGGNWTSGSSVAECNMSMLVSGDYSDVTFLVGFENHVFRAHRYVLVSRSLVFRAMLTSTSGHLARCGEIIAVPEIEPHVFKEFLTFMYADIANITLNNIMGLIYASRKYALDALRMRCETLLTASLCENNVCGILEDCHRYGILDWEKRALNVLVQATTAVVDSPDFVHLCPDCLESFLRSEVLDLSEAEILDAVMTWVRQRCDEEDVTDTPANVRYILGDMRLLLRYGDMDRTYLENVVGPVGLLTSEELAPYLKAKVEWGCC